MWLCANGSYARSASGGPRQTSSAWRSSSLALRCLASLERIAPVAREALEALGVELGRVLARARNRRRA